MSAPVVRIEGLTKRLRGVLAVDNLNLVVEQGQVVGLTGPNGSGKSVTLRILLGLVRPTAGRAYLFGEPVRAGAPALARVGALIDGPGFVPHLSGYDNLRIAQQLMHRYSQRNPERGPGPQKEDAEIEPALQIAGLGRAMYRPYATYSHGMKYRLALAQALLGHPDLLVLDEPTTGLDPVHIREIRDVIAETARGGTTVLFTSHSLAEVEQVCTHAAVMQSGRLIAAGRIDELVPSASAVVLEVRGVARAVDALQGFPGATHVTSDGARLLVEGESLNLLAMLTLLDRAGVEVCGFRKGQTLETAYVALMDRAESVPGGSGLQRGV